MNNCNNLESFEHSRKCVVEVFQTGVISPVRDTKYALSELCAESPKLHLP